MRKGPHIELGTPYALTGRTPPQQPYPWKIPDGKSTSKGCEGIVRPDQFLAARVKSQTTTQVLVIDSLERDGTQGASFACRDFDGDV